MPRELKDWLTSYMQYVENEEPARLYQKWVGMGVISAALQRKCWIHRGKLLFYPNLYILLVGPSGVARKGEALKSGKRLMESIPVKCTSNRITSAELIRTLGTCSTVSTLFDGTQLSHSSLCVLSEELTVLLRDTTGEMIEILTDWFDCSNKWDNKTKVSGCEYVNNVCVTLIGATTPQKLAKLPKAGMEGGFIGRLVVAYARKKHHSEPLPIEDSNLLALWEKLKVDLDSIYNLSGGFTTTQAWEEAYADWYYKSDEDPPFRDELFCGYNSRRAALLHKLCIILSASRSDSKIIDECDLFRAIDMLMEIEVDMRMAFSGVGDNRLLFTQEEVEMLVREKKIVSAAELMMTYKRHVSSNELTEILTTLHRSGVIRWVKAASGELMVEKV